MSMILTAKALLIFGLISCGVLGRNVERNSEFSKETDGRNGGSMLMEIAKEFVQRSSTSTQMLNLNLSNLLLLLMLKAVVFGAGYLGNQGYKAREVNQENLLTEGEVSLALGYLVGDTCLYRAACEQPNVAKEYLGAAEIILETFKLLSQDSQFEEEKYEQTIRNLRKAVEHGIRDDCPSEYTCTMENMGKYWMEERPE